MYYILARICGLGRGEVISIQVQMNWNLHAERMKLLPRFRGDFHELLAFISFSIIYKHINISVNILNSIID